MSAVLVRLPQASGPLAGALAAVGLLVAHLAGIRWGIGVDGLGILSTVNDEVIAVTAPLILQALIGAGALGGYLTVPPDGRRIGVLDGSDEKALAVVGVFCAVALPLVAGRPLLDAPHSASLFWLGVAAEAAVAAGILLALAVLHGRLPVMALKLVVGLPLVHLAGQAVLGWVLLPSAAELPGLSGEELAALGKTMRIGRMVLTVGVLALAAGVVAARTIGPWRRRPAESRLDRERGDHA